MPNPLPPNVRGGGKRPENCNQLIKAVLWAYTVKKIQRPKEVECFLHWFTFWSRKPFFNREGVYTLLCLGFFPRQPLTLCPPPIYLPNLECFLSYSPASLCIYVQTHIFTFFVSFLIFLSFCFWFNRGLPLFMEDPGLIPGLKRSLEKGKATHSSILAWRIPWTSPWVTKSWTRLSNFHSPG